MRTTQSQKVLADCRQLSSGTVASLSGARSYVGVERVQARWVKWVTRQPTPFATWQEAWNAFRPHL